MTSTPREQVASLLGTMGAGSFAARRTGAADHLELTVKGVGPIRFPIPRAQAQRLLGISQPARYGRRERTLLDRRVRDTGEIPAGRIKIVRRRWNRTLQPMLAALGTDLGLDPAQRLSAELHAMLVYGPGQFFKQHQDSERADGMVGTLVVTLPSTFTGGAIVVAHRGQVVSYRASKQALSFIAFYADCRHEIRPVRSGYRIVLTYDLMLEGEATGAPAPESDVVDMLVSPLRAHFTTPLPRSPYEAKHAPRRPPPSRLVYLLDHEYTARGLGWGRLKGSDAARAAALRAAAERAGCEVVLGLAAVQETWECEEPWEPEYHGRRRYWERDEEDEDDEWVSEDERPADDPDAYVLGDLIDSSVSLERMVDAKGGASEPIVTSVAEHEVCATTPSSALTPHAAEYEGYMGNYGNTMDRWYRRAAIVLWPRERAFVVRAEASPGWALAALLERLRAGELQECRELAASLLPSWSDVAAREEHRGLFAPTLRVAALLDSHELAAALLRPFQREAVTPRLARDIAALVARYGEGWTRDLLAGWASPESRRLRSGERDVLAWLSGLERLAAAVVAAGPPAGATAARLLIDDAWRMLQLEIRRRRRLSPPSLRERTLLELDRPILGWLGGASVLEAQEATQGSAGTTSAGERPIERAVGYLCADENAALVPCFVRLLRTEANRAEPARRAALGLDAVARHCATELRARLQSPPRAAGDWSVAPPAGCDCALCRKLATFLADSAQRRLEWPLAKAGRQHVHQRIDHDELPVRHETRRSGSPYTLVLEKTGALFGREATARQALQKDLDWLSHTGWIAPESGAGP